MKSTDSKILLDKYNLGTCTEEERAIVAHWFLTWEDEGSVPSKDKIERVKEEVWQSLPVHKREVKLWPRIAAVAAVLAVITVGAWLYNSFNAADPTEFISASQDIAPAEQGATITLGTGKVIRLNGTKSGVVVGREMKYDDGSAVISDRNDDRGRTLTATTAKGQTYQFTLPDGTRVWLNADSKLEFPSNFANSKSRNVKLSGEGYFEVVKDKAHPFIVKSNQQQLKVLGTHFNINAYADEGEIRTTLLEGSVMIFPDAKHLSHIVIKPGQQSKLDETGLSVRNVEVGEAVAWKNGDFVFKGESLQSAMRQIARWYNVAVIYDANLPKDVVFWGYVARSRNISVMLRQMENTKQVKFKLEGRTVRVLPF